MTNRILTAIAFCASAWAQQLQMEFVRTASGEFLMGCAPTDSPALPDGTYNK